MRSTVVGTCVLWLAVGLTVARAEDFRVESTVLANKQKVPVSHSSTLFHAGVVYDYLANPPRTAVLDKAHGRFILLDEDRHEKAELTLTDVSTAVTNLRLMAEKSPNAFLKFVANPKFEPKVDEQTGALVFASPVLTYRTKTVPAPSAEVAAQYRDFLDWTARLNAIITPASPPPFARLAVNEEVARRNLVPETVELVIPKQLALGGRGLALRSEHVLTWRLLQKDLDRIAETGSQMASFKLVPFAEYRKNQPQ
jgi:hypothetical protein